MIEKREAVAPFLFKLTKWKPVYDLIVAGHIIGYTNVELAERYDYTPVMIRNILHSEKALELIKQASEKIRETSTNGIVEEVERDKRIKELVKKRTQDFLERDDLADASPFKYMSIVSKVAAGGKVEALAPNVTNNNVQINNTQVNQTNNLTPAHIERMTKALELSAGAVEIPDVDRE